MLSRADFKPYQDHAVQWLKAHPHTALWVPMGMGKTAATLTAFSEMGARFDARRILVVAPLRVARSVWLNETRTWGHLNHLTVSRILGSVDERMAALRVPADVYTINRENVKWLEGLFIRGKKQVRPWPWDMVVLDESQSFRSQASERFKSMRRLRKLIPRLVELTGTPSPNGLANLWSQIFLLDRGERLGLTEDAYRQRWFNPPGYDSYTWTPKPHAEKEVYARLADIVFSLRESDWFDMTPVVPNWVRVQLPAEALRRYKQMERQYITQTYSGRKVTAVNAGVCVGKRMQLANGSVYVNDSGDYEEFHTEKLDALVELLEGIETPVIVAYAFRSDFKRIADRLARDFGKARTVAWLADQATEEAWNRGEIDVLLLYPESAGHGLNLQFAGAEDLIWFGLTYNLEHVQQVFARLGGGHRRGSRPLRVHYIVADGTVDEDILVRVEGKAAAQDALTGAIAETTARQGRDT